MAASLTRYPLKILVVSQYFWPENFRINDLASELKKKGHEVTVLTGYPNYPDGKVFEDFTRNPHLYSLYDGVEVVRVPLFPRGQGAFRLALNYASFALSACFFGVLKLRKKKFDRIFVFEPSPVTVGLPAILLRWLKKAPVAFWVLDLWPDSLKAVGVVKSRVVLRLVGYLVSFIYSRCDVLLAQSKSFVIHIQKYCRKDQKIEFFPNWAEDIFSDQISVEPAEELMQFEGTFKILFAGNIGDAQDFPAVLAAAELTAQQKDIQWIIVGDGRAAEWVKQEIVRLGLSNTVTMLGRFPLERMPSFYTAADALLVSLKADEIFSLTIPGKVQSYLAAGKPLLAMLDGEGASVILDAEAGLVSQAGAAADLAKAASELAAMKPEQRYVMGESGYRYYMAEFRRDALICRLEQLLLHLHIK
ncbi:MAG: glycosyltransferase family 4 protein [Herminiimonas sp.]|uniref:glycosyltransferase family 4 protein n=1 Tax=Herminiimonas sp. TaxID=1926289 RepID=UPI00271FB852|nr:glycosyltransferase family 4 protein [Herminiimonas sp.]MDO9419781.1 glycosyltransferase family 4 protein [Herminiimonas sp.]